MRKVLVVIDRMSVGGVPSVVLEQLRGIDRTRFEPWLLTLYHSKTANFLADAKAAIGSEHVVERELWHRSIFDVATLWGIYRLMRREKFDVVVTHLFLGNLIGRTLAIMAGVPRIVSFEHSRYAEKRMWQRVADKLLAKKTYRIGVPNEAVAQFTAAQEHISAAQFTVVDYPISLPPRDEATLTMLRARWQVSDAVPVFLCIGRFSEEKGQAVLIEAAALTASRGAAMTVLIIGHGALQAHLESLVAKYQIQDSCRLVADPLYAKHAFYLADAFVLPSFREGKPLVVHEAMMAGLPTIASDLPTLHGFVEENVTGVFVPAGDTEQLARALTAFAADPERRRAMGAAAKKAAAHFDPHAPIRQLEALLV